MRRILFILTLLLCATVVSSAQKLDAPKLVPTAINNLQKQLLEEGIQLHEKGDFDTALLKYAEVLSINPDSVEALYESSYACYEKKDYKCSVEFGLRAAQYKSEILPSVYIQLGSAYDELRQPETAVEVYKYGIKLFPKNYLLHYNLALTYTRTGKGQEAKAAVKRSAMFNPAHPTSQIMLADIYLKTGYKTPALLAACRFLVIEPKSARSQIALRILRQVVDDGVSKGKDSNTINILVQASPAKTDEGDFSHLDFFYPLLKASNMTQEKKDRTPAELAVDSLASILSVLEESRSKADTTKFPVRYYLPYYGEIKKRGYAEPFAYFILQSSDIPGVKDWLTQHQDKVSEFLAWSKNYSWPEPW